MTIADRSFFTVTWDGEIRHYSSMGTLLKTLTTNHRSETHRRKTSIALNGKRQTSG
jgi:hypothetical protein